MNTCLRRQPTETSICALRRIGTFTVALFAMAGIWWFARPGLLYNLARFNLGNSGCPLLLDRAIVERHPELTWRRDESSRYRNAWNWHTSSFDTGRRRSAIASDDGATFSTEPSRWRIFDERLDLIAEVRCGYMLPVAPDDRDGDGTLELALHSFWNSKAATGVAEQTYAVVRLGREKHSLIALVRDTKSTAAATIWAPPIWVNDEHDQTHELVLLDYVTGTTGQWSPYATLKLRWAEPGKMEVDGAIPATYKVWLAESPEQVTFSPDEDIQSVIERVLKDK